MSYIKTALLDKSTQSGLTIRIYIDTSDNKKNLSGESWYATNATIEYYSATTGELINEILGQRYKGNKEINFTQIPNAKVITEIKSGAFEGCTNLALTELPQNITKIGSNAFKDCSNIKITNIPSNCIEIGNSAFKGCTGLTKIETLADNAILIGDEAFCNCTNIRNVNLSNVYFDPKTGWAGVQFGRCTSLEEITLGSINHPVSYIKTALLDKAKSGLTIRIYIDTSDNKKNLSGESWYATNATIKYYDSATGKEIN